MSKSPDLQVLESKRQELLDQLAGLGDFRRGTISVNYRKCGRPNCACARPGHPGHGPQYLWNATIDGRSRARNLRLGPELEKVGREVENHRRFLRLCEQLVQVNEQICELRPQREVQVLRCKPIGTETAFPLHESWHRKRGKRLIC